MGIEPSFPRNRRELYEESLRCAACALPSDRQKQRREICDANRNHAGTDREGYPGRPVSEAFVDADLVIARPNRRPRRYSCRPQMEHCTHGHPNFAGAISVAVRGALAEAHSWQLGTTQPAGA